MNLEDLENRINKLQNKKKRRNLELTGIVAIAGRDGVERIVADACWSRDILVEQATASGSGGVGLGGTLSAA